MTEESSLQELVLGYCRQVGGWVEPPAYGTYEVLLPDEVAARWGVDPIQKFAFSGGPDGEAAAVADARDDSLTLITYGHPLVDTIVAELRRQVANGRFFVNNVRLEKPGLFAAFEKALSLPNAKLFPAHGVVERQRLYHLVRFNFKVSLISDEKRELILPVWMHLQAGYAVNGSEIERLAIFDAENRFAHLAPASPIFLEGERPALSDEVLHTLLERARQAAVYELAPNLAELNKRLQRFLELDRARLGEYFDDLISSVEKRLRKAEEERRPALEAKLAAIRAEREAKLGDVEQKYRLQVELELVNLALIAQPKLDLLVEIRKRTRTVQRRATWDPLRHVVEPLVCDVCGQPGDGLYLCEEGHLAHSGCLAPQCVECKRTYCRKCSGQVRLCVVCDRPVCAHSSVECPQCRRVTCHDHLNECHALEGGPRRAALGSPPPAVDTGAPAPPAREKTAHIQTPARKKAPSKVQQSTASSKPALPAARSAGNVEVYADPAESAITAVVIVRKRELATRRWEMTDEGISSQCYCEKGTDCDKNGIVYRPFPDSQLETQVLELLKKLRDEYGIGASKIHYYQIRAGQVYKERKLKIPSLWRDPALLARARQGFDQLAARKPR